MKQVITGLMTGLALLVFTQQAKAQSAEQILNSIFGNKTAQDKNGSQAGHTASINGLTQTEIVSGLREALNVGARNAGSKLSNVNGFFGNALIKILMPPEVRQVENTMRSLGMGSLVDKAILSMNRAAEDAASKAVPIFVNAITTMSIQDGVGILRGGPNAATNFLQAKTNLSLTNAFRPVIQSSLNKVQATAYWRDIFMVYNRLPTTQNKVNTDLTAYVTERALNGLFVTIAEEERKIRTNPAARISGILQKVFGAN